MNECAKNHDLDNHLEKNQMIKNDNIVVVYENEVISCENIFNLFWKTNTNILYVVDDDEHFVGIITDRSLLNQVKENEQEKPFINKECFVITNEDETNWYEEAEMLFEKYHITTAIPVVDRDWHVCYEIRKEELEKEEEIIAKFRDKISKYEKSFYLEKELACLKRLLEEQDIVIIGTEERYDNLFDILSVNKGRIQFIEELENAYEFMQKNKNLMIDMASIEYKGRTDICFYCNNGYHWKQFVNLILDVIEAEYCSKFYRMCDNGAATFCDFLDKYLAGNLHISQRSIFTAHILKYIQEKYFKAELKEGVFRNGFQFPIKLNGIEIDKSWVEYEKGTIRCVDIISQLYDLNKKVTDKVKVLNFVFDEKLEALETELGRMSIVHLKEAYEYEALYTLGENNNSEFLNELKDAVQLVSMRSFENDRVVFKDIRSRLVNVENGIRKTCYQPLKYDGTIYFFGGCTVWGAAVEDKYTIPSLIQKLIIQSGRNYRVINLGNNLINAECLLNSLEIRENDIFVCLFPFITDYVKRNISLIEIGACFNRLRIKKYEGSECFSNMVQHCGTNGNIIYSEIIFDELNKYLKRTFQRKNLQKDTVYQLFRANIRDLELLYGYKSYIAALKNKTDKKILDQSKRIGCIVMNCNPFTLGHRYLVEYALAKVDYLYLFVVEEDKSHFSFADRYEMVLRGVDDLDNVLVFGSGKMCASSITFPAYFHKREEVLANTQPSVGLDLKIFGQYIASALHIHFRFVGEEPFDLVTSAYNERMKEILPEFGVDVIEIPRKTVDGKVISAAEVRELYKKKDLKNLSKYIPDTTLQYLMQKVKS